MKKILFAILLMVPVFVIGQNVKYIRVKADTLYVLKALIGTSDSVLVIENGMVKKRYFTGGSGTIGPTGPTGPIGPTGASGVDGATGPTGPQGIQGVTGAAGTNGIDGATGPTGVAGATGATGTSYLTRTGNVLTTTNAGDIAVFGATGTTGASTMLYVYGGAFMMAGATGATPTSGAGDRFMVIPDKNYAIRCGGAATSDWDAANIGTYSMGIGNAVKASGINSAAINYQTVSSGPHSFAMNEITTASGRSTISTGRSCTASGEYASAFGFGNTAQAQACMTIGKYAPVSGTTNSFVTTEALWLAGNGSGTTANTSIAAVLLKNGNFGINGRTANDFPNYCLQVNAASNKYGNLYLFAATNNNVNKNISTLGQVGDSAGVFIRSTSSGATEMIFKNGIGLTGYIKDTASNVSNAGWYNYGADAGGTDDYAISIEGITKLTTGMTVTFYANTANTGACTLNVSGLGAKPLKVKHDQDPENDYIEAGSMIQVVYDGTNYQVQTPDANP